MYTTGAAFSLPSLFERDSAKQLHLKFLEAVKILGFNKVGARDLLCAKVFAECFYMILEDMLENNITFTLPLGKKHAEIHMKRISGKQFQCGMKGRKFKDIDFLKTQFVAYRPYFFMHTNNRDREKQIYTTIDYRKRLDEKVNNGKKYC